MSPIPEGERILKIPARCRGFSVRAVLGRYTKGRPVQLGEIGEKGYYRLVKPLEEFVKEKEYALYLLEKIEPDGTTEEEVLTHEEWKLREEQRRQRDIDLEARVIFDESSRHSIARTGDMFIYG